LGRGTRALQSHQLDVALNWRLAGDRGIVAHATGAGKTLSALYIVREWITPGRPALILVPTELLLAQWIREIGRELSDLDVGILQAGGVQRRQQWKRHLADFSREMPGLGPRIIIATLQTASTESFATRLQEGPHLLLVVDEVHRVGSPVFRRILEIRAGGRLGLSATPDRYGDPEGTSLIKTYFGQILQPEFTIADALKAGRLVPYDYFVHAVSLTDSEQVSWDKATTVIRQEYAKLPETDSGSKQYTEHFRLLLIKRAKIIKHASGKVGCAVDIVVSRFGAGDRWLLYCDDTRQLRALVSRLEALRLPVAEYHSKMEADPDDTLRSFSGRGGVLVAIKCLDEGVDVPAVNRAIILASSANPREFIQRRGRVLRSMPGKHSAVIHDLIAMPSPRVSAHQVDRSSILRTELTRAYEFAKTARNVSTLFEIESIAREANIDDFRSTISSFEED
jgi:superfamily II DNA or RNA helicase